MHARGIDIQTVEWTTALEWNTGLDYWTELFFFFGQISVYISTFFQVPGYYG